MTETTSKIVRVNGIDLYVEIHGAGEPLLLLHGFTGTSQDWIHAGRAKLAEHFRLIAVDARGHGRSTNPAGTLTHQQCARDTLSLLDQLGIRRCKAIGMSFGGNTLLHVAAMAGARIDAMVIVSATPYFPEQARAIMKRLPLESQSQEAWASMRERHKLGDDQIRALFEQQYAFHASYDDLHFTPPELSRITARTLIVQGDRDPLYPLELSMCMYRALPNAALWVVPAAGHGPIFLAAAPAFAQNAVNFLQAESISSPPAANGAP
jgi:pimeloyl-ACP methyl ester carboxylesterase